MSSDDVSRPSPRLVTAQPKAKPKALHSSEHRRSPSRKNHPKINCRMKCDINRESVMISIRIEEARDYGAVSAINLAAFEGGPEADLVDTLRLSCADHLSLVAEEDGMLVGHILFTPVMVESPDGVVEGMGLAPMAVTPERHRCGVGSKLVRHGLEVLQKRSCPFVVVLGHPEYYPRFGFERASDHSLRSQWEGVPDEAFMVLVFDSEILPDGGGVARYRDEFDAAM